MPPQYPQVIGRYVLFEPIASGGMGMIHLGRLHGPHGFSRTVAIKRLHPSCVHNPELVVMLSDEARLAARIEHPNVVRTLDVVSTDDELLVILELVQGVSLARVCKDLSEPIPMRIAVSIMIGVLYGLEAAHEATGENGAPLNLVHRDVSPQNILVGVDGTARVLDFGIAKAMGRLHTTRDGSIKGKMAYMPVEQLGGEEVDRRADLYAAAVVLWETLTGKRLFSRDSDAATVTAVLHAPVVPPSKHVPAIPEALDAIVMRGLSRDREKRFSSALEMAAALESLSMAATPREVGELLKSIAKEPLTALSGAVRAVEAMSVESEATLDTSSAVRAATLSSPGEMTTTQNALFTSDSGSGATHAPPPTPAPAQSPRRGALAGGMIGATVIVALIATAAVRYRTTPATITTPAVASSTPTSSMSPGPSAAAPEASSLALASAHVPDAPAATSATTPAPSASVALGAGGRKRPGSRPSTAASASAAPKADPCDPPYVIDEAGVRRVKRECIK